MSFSIIRYYFYLEDEQAVFDNYSYILKDYGLNYQHSSYSRKLKIDGSEQFFYELESEKIKILVVKLGQPDSSWSDLLGCFHSLEQKASIQDEQVLGKVSVLMTSGLVWEKLLDNVGSLFAYRTAEQIEIDQGKIAYLSGSWSIREAFYACTLEEESKANRQLVGYGLAILEARIINLRLIAGLFRDRRNAISEEKEVLDTKLSNILHSHLVSEHGSLGEVEELEAQIQELSASYGIIAGDYSLVLDGCNRISSLLDSLSRQLDSEPAMYLEPQLKNRILEPYQRRLQELINCAEELCMSRENHQAAIEVVRSKIDIMNGRANIATQQQIRNLMELNISMQKQSLVFQYAAGLIEFIVLAYYSHSLWSHLAHDAYQVIPTGIQFIFVMAFSGNTVYTTHLLSEYMQGEVGVKRRLIFSIVPLIAILIIVIVASSLISVNAFH
jgi:hypothetical protein